MKHPEILIGLVLAVGACGGKEPVVAAPAREPMTASSSTVVMDTSDDDEDSPSAVASAAAASAYSLAPLDHKNAISLTVLLPVPDPAPPSGFPSATNDDKTCTRAAGLTGRLERDFEELAAACGKNTGMKEYAKSMVGPLNAAHKHEEFSLKLAGGYCYRMFAVADGTVEKLGVRLHRANGALHSVIQGKQPVVILRPNQAWCRRRDAEFQVVLESLGAGEGRYAFGVYARPNEKGRAPARTEK